MGEAFIEYALSHMAERDLNELQGIVEGVALDGCLNAAELEAVRRWCTEMEPRLTGAHWDVLRLLTQASADGVIDDEERAEIIQACRRLRETKKHFSQITKDMQTLHGVLAGLSADGLINQSEMNGLRGFLEQTAHLKGHWPYDEIDSLVTATLADGRIDETEHRFLLAYASQFIEHRNDLLTEPLSADLIEVGICAAQPEVIFEGKKFVVTGHSPKASRAEMHEHILARGGRPHPRVTNDVDFLVVADGNNVAWAFSCYGRKIEAAMKLRRQGALITLVHESDFWDAIADSPPVAR